MNRWQFSLQTFILVVAIIALAIAWWNDHRVLTERLRDAQKKIQFLETSRFYDSPSATRR